LPRPALALGHEQFGRCAVVECHGLLLGPSKTMDQTRENQAAGKR
jgi:hypothetical protein